ncbi:MAG: ABC transporter permease [Phycisphaerales bacterium]
MYHSLLTRRYLTTRLMPLLAALAVMLCTAMVLIVWSVMGGFLNMLLASGRTMAGDVLITWPTVGFAYYDDLIARLEKQTETVAAATPIIETLGVINLPDGRVEGIQVKGIDAASYARVVDFNASLWWRPVEEPVKKDRERRDLRLSPEYRERLEQTLQDGLTMSQADTGAWAGGTREGGAGGPGTPRRPAMVSGIELLGLSQRETHGFYSIKRWGKPDVNGDVQMKEGFAPNEEVTLRVLPLDKKGRTIDMASRVFPVANEFRTGIFEIDRRTALVPLPTLQRMLKMDAAKRLDTADLDTSAVERDTETGRETFDEVRTLGEEPARATTVLVRGRPGVSPEAVRDTCLSVYADFAAARGKAVPAHMLMTSNRLIRTWEENNAQLVGAVKKETIVVLSILTFISVTASFLILAIFWAMVSEKTRDVGILRAVGASRAGIAWLWLRYGLAIGVVGSACGGLLAFAVIHNINEIHDYLGAKFQVAVWDPKVYYFTEIPSVVEPWKAALVLSCGLFFSAVGALIPAIRAASMDPVQALRFE